VGTFTIAEFGRHMDEQDSHRWEYEILRPPRDETKKEAENPKVAINELAAEGWRLVETIDYSGGGTKYIVFERPRSAATGDGS
jgi:hypothetical protein